MAFSWIITITTLSTIYRAGWLIGVTSTNEVNSSHEFSERLKPEYLEKNLVGQRRQATNLTHVNGQVQIQTDATLVESKCSHHHANPYCAQSTHWLVTGKPARKGNH